MQNISARRVEHCTRVLPTTIEIYRVYCQLRTRIIVTICVILDTYRTFTMVGTSLAHFAACSLLTILYNYEQHSESIHIVRCGWPKILTDMIYRRVYNRDK